jgi:hypothetical protein
MPRKTLPTPDFAPVYGQKLWGLKNPGGGAVAKSRQGAKKKEWTAKKVVDNF